MPAKMKQGKVSPFSNFVYFLHVVRGGKEYYEKHFATLRSLEKVDSIESPHAIEYESVHAEQVPPIYA